jgi:selenium metabolism protein YedF
MPKTVDARRLACLHPVILTKKALEEADEVITIVDNETARENVSRLAKSQGCQLSIEKQDDGIYLHLTKKAAGLKEPAVTLPSKSTLLLIASDNMGRGVEELGNILMRSFIHTLGEVTPRPDKIVFLNSGVKLVAEGSEVIDDLLDLTKHGIEMLACGTCLGYYNLKEAVKVGQISNMYDIASALLQAGKIIAV